MLYIKKFNNYNLYNNYKNSLNFKTPNLSLCKYEKRLYYTPRKLISQIEYIESSGSNHIIIPLTHFPILSTSNDKYFKVYSKFDLIDHGYDIDNDYTLLNIFETSKQNWYYHISRKDQNVYSNITFDKQNNWNQINTLNATIPYNGICEFEDYTWINNWHLANLYLFTYYKYSTDTLGWHSIARLYELKIWDNNDNLILHLVPYKNELTNETYIHDNITNNDYHFIEAQ